MPRVTSLDGKVYELDEATLEKFRIPDEELRRLRGNVSPLPPPPPPSAPPPGETAVFKHGGQDASVSVRRGPGNSTIIELKLPEA